MWFVGCMSLLRRKKTGFHPPHFGTLTWIMCWLICIVFQKKKNPFVQLWFYSSKNCDETLFIYWNWNHDTRYISSLNSAQLGLWENPNIEISPCKLYFNTISKWAWKLIRPQKTFFARLRAQFHRFQLPEVSTYSIEIFGFIEWNFV